MEKDDAWIIVRLRDFGDKYEDVYLKAYESLADTRKAIAAYIEFYNSVRSYQALNYKTPDQLHEQKK